MLVCKWPKKFWSRHRSTMPVVGYRCRIGDHNGSIGSLMQNRNWKWVASIPDPNRIDCWRQLSNWWPATKWHGTNYPNRRHAGTNTFRATCFTHSRIAPTTNWDRLLKIGCISGNRLEANREALSSIWIASSWILCNTICIKFYAIYKICAISSGLPRISRTCSGIAANWTYWMESTTSKYSVASRIFECFLQFIKIGWNLVAPSVIRYSLTLERCSCRRTRTGYSVWTIWNSVRLKVLRQSNCFCPKLSSRMKSRRWKSSTWPRIKDTLKSVSENEPCMRLPVDCSTLNTFSIDREGNLSRPSSQELQ